VSEATGSESAPFQPGGCGIVVRVWVAKVEVYWLGGPVVKESAAGAGAG